MSSSFVFKKGRFFFNFNLLLFVILLILGYHSYQDYYKAPLSISNHYGKKLEFVATVCQAVGNSVSSQSLVVCLPDSKILLTLRLQPSYSYGDKLLISGRLDEAPIFDDFNYYNYLASQGIYATMYYPQVSLISKTKLSQSYRAKFSQIKAKLVALANRNLAEPEASLANALILGEKKSLFKEEKEAFRQAGLSHLLVISGTHITILVALFFAIFTRLGFSFRSSLRLVFLFLLFYSSLLSYSPSAIRAIVMGALTYLALYHHRLASSQTSLLVAANVLLLINPLSIYRDLGFQLSFLAVLALIYIYPLLPGSLASTKTGPITKVPRYLKDSLLITTACQILLFPWLSYHFGQVSYLVFLSNPLVAWLVPPLLFSLVFSYSLSLIIPSFSLLFFTPSYLLLALFNNLTKTLASLAPARQGINFSQSLMIVYYCLVLLLVVVVRYRRFKRGEKRRLAVNKKLELALILER